MKHDAIVRQPDPDRFAKFNILKRVDEGMHNQVNGKYQEINEQRGNKNVTPFIAFLDIMANLMPESTFSRRKTF